MAAFGSPSGYVPDTPIFKVRRRVSFRGHDARKKRQTPAFANALTAIVTTHEARVERCGLANATVDRVDAGTELFEVAHEPLVWVRAAAARAARRRKPRAGPGPAVDGQRQDQLQVARRARARRARRARARLAQARRRQRLAPRGRPRARLRPAPPPRRRCGAARGGVGEREDAGWAATRALRRGSALARPRRRRARRVVPSLSPGGARDACEPPRTATSPAD